MNCVELERNLDCFKTGEDVYGNTVKFNFSESPSGPGYGQGKGFEITSENDDSYQVIFYCYDNGTLNLGNMTLINEHDQMEVAKFLRQDPEEWFEELKYNIIIGKDTDVNEKFCAYWHSSNSSDSDFLLNDNTTHEDLSKDEYKFNTAQINDLKLQLPDYMAKIVDLGKVEVKK